MKTNSQRDGDVWAEENGTKSRRESKLLEIFCFLSSKYWAERGEGGVMVITAGTWYLTCDTGQHYRGCAWVWSLSVWREWREIEWEPVIKIEKKNTKLDQSPTWHSVHDEMCNMYEAGVFILHYIKVCCWYCDIQYPCERFALRYCNQSGWLDDLSAE